MAAIGSDDCVAKGPVTHCLDVLSKMKDGGAKLKKLRKAVFARRRRDFTGLEKVFAKDLFEASGMSQEKITRATDYLKKFWFDEEKGWWQSQQPIAETFGEGLLKALDASLKPTKAGKKPIPMDCYWIIGNRQFQVLTLENPQQVTLLFLTPTPKNRKPGKIWSEWAKVSVTARRGDGNVQTTQVQKID